MSAYGTFDSATACLEAATLFAAAARHPRTGAGTGLQCLAAQAALEVSGRPVRVIGESLDPDTMILHALRVLGSLSPQDFDDPRVLAAARHGRRALREPH
jgi:hypothetical protein